MRFLLAFICFSSLFSQVTGVESELDKLIGETNPPQRFAAHTPAFSLKTVTQEFQGPSGPYKETFEVIYDNNRAIALRSNRPQLDLFTHDPGQGFEAIPWPARYHNATIWGTRLTTIPGWANGDQRSEHKRTWAIAEDGGSITLHEWQVWDGSSKDMQVPGRADYYFTFRVDPILGYVIDLDARMEFTGQPKGRRGNIDGFSSPISLMAECLACGPSVSVTITPSTHPVLATCLPSTALPLGQQYHRWGIF